MTNKRDRSAIETWEATRYEVAVIREGKILEILGYSARKTRAAIQGFMNRDLTKHFTQAELKGNYAYSSKTGFTFGSNIRIGFTGNTERSPSK